MLAHALLLSLCAAPRTDGVWLPAKLAAKAAVGSGAELVEGGTVFEKR